jgi:hypothetical protein
MHSVDVIKTLIPVNKILTLPVTIINEERNKSNLYPSLPVNIVNESNPNIQTSAFSNTYHLTSRTNYKYQALTRNATRKSLNVAKDTSRRHISLDSSLKKVYLQ